MVKAGRFGEYVTDGEYNATLRKDDSVEAITLERAAELLAERRARGPAKKAAKRGAKKAGAKKSREEVDQEGGGEEVLTVHGGPSRRDATTLRTVRESNARVVSAPLRPPSPVTPAP